MEPIEPKPTRYKETLYRSVLEARWAVFLDHHPSVKRFTYEEVSFKTPTGLYTPDFTIYSLGTRRGSRQPLSTMYLEVKPAPVSEEYAYFLAKTVPLMEHPFILGFGGWYREDRPYVCRIHNTITKVLIARFARNLDSLFPNSYGPAYTASTWRFDI